LQTKLFAQKVGRIANLLAEKQNGSTHNDLHQIASATVTPTGTKPPAAGQELDPELTQVILTWPKLPARIRRAILALVSEE
jgi:hypothetical protein